MNIFTVIITKHGRARGLEIPIVWQRVKELQSERILEVGNVLSHYFSTRHVVVDKYEVWPKVINEDILTFESQNPYDLIVSISTLEHIGFSIKRGVEDPKGFQRSISRLITLLSPYEQILFTVPLGYNPFVDRYLEKLKQYARLTFMKRISYDNKWRECSLEEAVECPYGGFQVRRTLTPPYPRANAILICEIGSPDKIDTEMFEG